MGLGLDIKKIIYSSIIIFLIISGGCIQGKNSIQKIGELCIKFESAKEHWKMNLEYKDLHNLKIKKYLLYEYGSWRAQPFLYFLWNMDTNHVESNYLPPNTIMPKNEIDKIRSLFNRVDVKNMIYDGVPYLLSDDVFIITYVDGNKYIEFGTLSIKYHEEFYIDQKIPQNIRDICQENIEIVKELFEISKTIK